MVVWGPEEDTRHRGRRDPAALRRRRSTGVPNETRQPFADGSTDFERILPGPDRMYPDTDCPPTRVTRERVDAPASGPRAERPWEREARYAAAGVPAPTIHYLIRRGRRAPGGPGRGRGGRRPAPRVPASSASGWRGCAAPAWTWMRFPPSAGSSCCGRSPRRPVLWEAWEPIVRAARRRARAAARRDAGVAAGSGAAPAGWRETVAGAAAEARRSARDRRSASACCGWPWASRCRRLRGRVPGAEVAARRARRDRRPADDRARATSSRGTRDRRGPSSPSFGVRVWSEVRLVNDAGSVFEGVILPRSETFDDLHIVIKMKNGYNVGIHVDRVGRDHRAGLQGGVLQDPGEGVPGAPAAPQGHAAGDRRDDRLAARLPHRRGDPGVHPGRALRRRPRAGRHLQPDDQEAVRRVLREHGEGALHRPRPRDRRGDRGGRGRHRDRTRHRHDGPHRRHPLVHGAGLARCRSSSWAASAPPTGRPRTPPSTSSTPCARRPAATSPR